LSLKSAALYWERKEPQSYKTTVRYLLRLLSIIGAGGFHAKFSGRGVALGKHRNVRNRMFRNLQPLVDQKAHEELAVKSQCRTTRRSALARCRRRINSPQHIANSVTSGAGIELLRSRTLGGIRIAWLAQVKPHWSWSNGFLEFCEFCLRLCLLHPRQLLV
jgi:hypothetical protein